MSSQLHFPASGDTIHVDVPYRRALSAAGDEVVILGDIERWAAILPEFPSSGPAVWSCCERLLGSRVSAAGAPRSAEQPLTVSEMVHALDVACMAARFERAQSVEDLALHIELGRVVVALVNAGICWGKPSLLQHGEVSHCLLVIGSVRDASSGGLTGFLVNDPARGDRITMDVSTLVEGWLGCGGAMVWANHP